MLRRRPRTSGLLRVEISEVRSLPKREAAWRQFWALCLCGPASRSWLRLAHVPFEARTAEGAKLALLRVETEEIVDVGAVMPHLGGETFRYDPLPAGLVARRRCLRFIYFDGKDLRPLNLAAVTALSEL